MSEQSDTTEQERVVGDADNNTLTAVDDSNTLIVAFDGDDSVTGAGGHDVLTAGGGNDTIDGGAGNDTIDGGDGNDWISGGTGADVFFFADGHGNDTITDFDVDEDVLELSEFGIDSFNDLSITVSGNDLVINLTEYDGGYITLQGVELADLGPDQFRFDGPVPDRRIIGHNGDQTINAGEGNDRVFGAGGNDTIDGEGGNDNITGGAGDDILEGGEGNDTLRGNAGDDSLTGGEGNDTLWGNAGDDSLTGGEGADNFAFEAGDGNDTISDFDTEDDVIDFREMSGVGSFSDITITQSGNDAVIDLTGTGGGQITLEDVTVDDLSADHFLFAEALHVTPTSGTEWMYGGAGNDTLEGDAGTNRMMGRDGDDTLEGMGGNDVYYGGEGADTFVIAPNNGNDTISDLVKGEDKIDLTAFSSITGFDDLTITSTGLFSFQIDLSDHGGGTVELYSYGDSVDFDELDATCFIFYDDGGGS